MKKIIVLAISVAALFCACNKETVIDTPVNQGKTVLTIAFPETKTILGEKDASGYRQTYWAEGDVVNVNGVDSEPLANVPANCTSASFTFGVIPSPYYAVYPKTIWVSNSKIQLPKTAINGVLPLGGVSPDNSLVLNALTSALKIQVKKKSGENPDTHKITLIEVSSATQQLSGLFSINSFISPSPVSASSEGADKVVQIIGDWELGDEPTEFIIPVPAGTYGIKVKIRDEEGHYMEQSTTSDKQFVQGQIKSLSPIEFNPDKTEIVITTPEEWNAFATRYNNGTIAAGARVVLGKTITFEASSNSSFTSITSFAGEFDGCGYAIEGLNVTAPLFGAITTAGSVKNVTLNGTFTYTHPAATNDNFGTIAKQLQGTLSKVKVFADASLSGVTNTKLIDFGGLIGRANNAKASIEDCQFNGNISIPANYSTSSSIRLGGLVGYTTKNLTISNSSFGGTIKCLGGVTSTATTQPDLNVGGIVGRNQCAIISNCETYDASTKPKVTIDEEDYSATILVQSNTYLYAAIGGIVGWNFDTGANITNCDNYASIFDNVTKSDNGTLVVGGIVGLSTASVSKCNNHAPVVHFSSSKTQHIGGIIGVDEGFIGTCYNETSANISVMGTPIELRLGGVIGSKTKGSFDNEVTIRNRAAISITAANESSAAYIGGVIGYNTVALDGSLADNPKVSNNANLTIKPGVVTSSDWAVGGVVGYSSADITNVSNNGGTIDFIGKYQDGNSGTGSTKNAIIGGVLGLTYERITVSNCKNTATVKYSKDVSTKTNQCPSYVGGIIGKMGNSSNGAGTIESCVNTGYINNTNSNNSHGLGAGPLTGGIVGAIVGASGKEGSIQQVKEEYKISDNGIYALRGEVGAIAGYASFTEINGTSCNVKLSGAPSSGDYRVGGAVGFMVSSSISNFNFSGTIVGGQGQIAGLVYNLDASSSIRACTFDGELSSTVTPGAIVKVAASGSEIKDCGVRGTINSVAITTDDSVIDPSGKASISGTYLISE